MKYLIVVDMQNDFIDMALGTAEAVRIVPNVKKKIEDAKADGVKVIFTMDTHTPDYLNTQEGRNLPVEHCIPGTEGWELSPELKELAEGELIFRKDTFGSKELARYLADINEVEPVEEVTLIGLCTDICVISNAMAIKAFLPEVPIKIDSSCCAGVTPESHSNALSAMAVCQMEIL